MSQSRFSIETVGILAVIFYSINLLPLIWMLNGRIDQYGTVPAIFIAVFITLINAMTYFSRIASTYRYDALTFYFNKFVFVLWPALFLTEMVIVSKYSDSIQKRSVFINYDYHNRKWTVSLAHLFE